MNTKITSIFDNDSQVTMTNESYPVYSYLSESVLDQKDIDTLLRVFCSLKLNKYYSCIEKAKITATYMGIRDIHFGSLMVESTEDSSFYGYAFNPPFELHAWVQTHNAIIDLALAGTIEKGLITKDDVGYYLTGRKPIALAGTPPLWARYTTFEIHPIKNVNILNLNKAREVYEKMYKK